VGSCRLFRLEPFRAVLFGVRAAETPSWSAELRVVRSGEIPDTVYRGLL
jgi:hypothetical protein